MKVVVCGSSDGEARGSSGGMRAGNVRSVVRALERAAGEVSGSVSGSVSFEIVVSADPTVVARGDLVVVPGQGAFGPFAHGVEGGLGDALREHIAKERPYLGICLGLQVLFDSSDEAPGAAGLGVLRGHVKRLEPGIDPATSRAFALPHMGWNAVVATNGASGADAPKERERYFYFAHTYAADPVDRSVVDGFTEYGAARFASAIRHGAIVGVQFHPEKSQREGLALLVGFLRGRGT